MYMFTRALSFHIKATDLEDLFLVFEYSEMFSQKVETAVPPSCNRVQVLEIQKR